MSGSLRKPRVERSVDVNLEKEKALIIEEAKKVVCDMAGTTDFGLTSKLQLALIIRNLVIDFHKKKAIMKALEEQIAGLKKQIEIMTK